MLIFDVPTAQNVAEFVSNDLIDRPHAGHHGGTYDDGVQIRSANVSKPVLALDSAASQNNV
jgi:hypothetical protein